MQVLVYNISFPSWEKLKADQPLVDLPLKLMIYVALQVHSTLHQVVAFAL